MKVLAIDQSTSATKAFTYDSDGRFEPVGTLDHAQHYPAPGRVEHDAEEILVNILTLIDSAGPVDAIGIDNQGETVVAWDAATGRALGPAIVWQDDRTRDVTEALKGQGAEALTQERAGLPLDPYFSATKLAWMLEHRPEVAAAAREGRLRLGTSDAFFLDRLTGDFATDVTTASRTSLMAMSTLDWDDDLLRLFAVPRGLLPEVRATTGPFGSHKGVPVTASLVDQQAALFGHGADRPGATKITFGTGAFALAITGAGRPEGAGGLSATVAWAMGEGPATFALEGGVYNAGSAVKWARSIGLFSDFSELNETREATALSRGLCFIPALSGLAAPHWDRGAAGLWIGMGLDTTRADLMQAVLEGVALRAAEVVGAMGQAVALTGPVSIDGGMSANPAFGQFLANALGREVVVAGAAELTALGTARMAMTGAGVRDLPPLPPPAQSFAPDQPLSAADHVRFADAVARARGWR